MSASNRSASIQVHDVRTLRLAQVGWLFTAVAAAAILFASIPGYLFAPSLGVFDEHLVLKAGTAAALLTRATNVASLLSAIVSLILALFLFLKKRAERMGLFLAYYLLGHGILFAGPIELLQPYWEAAPWVNSFILLPLFFGPMTMALITLFPDGRFVPHWSRWLILISLLAVPVSILSGGNTVPANINLEPPYAAILIVLSIVSAAAGFIIAIYIQFRRYRKVSTPEQRLQTRWVIYGIGLWFAVNVVTTAGWTIGLQLPANTPVPAWLPLTSLFWVSSSLLLPTALTISITRYRLFEIDLIINRTLVYGALTVGVVVIYVLVVAALGILFQTQGNLFVSMVATAVVAVAFQPLREWLQRAVNRLVYGERDDPFEALTRLGRRLENAISPEMVYPTIVETVVQALKLPYVALAVKRDEEFNTVEQSGGAGYKPAVFPLIHQGEEIGRLVVGQRGSDERFTRADERLLRSFARQASAAVHAVRLTAELQQSRYELVTAREEERLRLRRDLHDGLGPALASVVWQAESARDLIAADPTEAARMLEASITQAQSALADIRRLVYGLRPPALDELGLIGALEQAAGQYQPIDVNIKVPGSLPTLPAASEVAAYRIVQEALKNAVEHGKAAKCVVRISFDGNLRVSIEDDGVGIAQPVRSGVGLISMRQRADELGGEFDLRQGKTGGTVVSVTLPVE